MSDERPDYAPWADERLVAAFGVVVLVLGAVVTVTGRFAVGVGLLLNAVVALLRTAALRRRRRSPDAPKRPPISLADLGVPALASVAAGLAVAGAVHGSVWRRVGAGALAASWAMVCMVGAFAHYEHLLGEGRRARRADRGDTRRRP